MLSTECWKALQVSSLFKADSREELVIPLGFSESEITARVANAMEKIKVTSRRFFPQQSNPAVALWPVSPVKQQQSGYSTYGRNSGPTPG